MKSQFLSKEFLIAAAFCANGAQAACLTSLEPYPDDYGWAVFPFANSCDYAVKVNLCVKSWPPGSEDPAYNLYSGTVYGNDRLDMIDGRWSAVDSYEWTEDGYQACPF